MRTDQEVSNAKWALTKVRSGEDGLPCVGSLVASSSLMMQRELLSCSSVISSPRAAALSSCVVEYQLEL